ncbi:hypothetical protein Glove_152g44 [Diversispora epigaea]|uniref:Crinkler effector protein N-terminal domain-containing protein n=1 Tax=Diversispora epigaea TaxID=1348612 RepID=A0A397IXC0_9GLOM|nr:hypothetical protein Glove_152g44 [Diversispora epigaea]
MTYPPSIIANFLNKKTSRFLQRSHKRGTFVNVDSKDLKLWKVYIPTDNENDKLTALRNNTNVNIKDNIEGEKLSSLDEIIEHFPTEKHIHIIVQRPDEKRRFIAPLHMSEKLHEIFAFPDGTENGHIIISRVMQKDETVKDATEHKVMQFSTNEDLISIIWNIYVLETK